MGAITDKIRGKAKQIEGKLTRNQVLVAQGTAQEAKGNLEAAGSRVARKATSAVRGVKARVKAELARSDRGTRVR
jgi:uncharacterized protein YjbJ (UPF0337 family)